MIRFGWPPGRAAARTPSFFTVATVTGCEALVRFGGLALAGARVLPFSFFGGLGRASSAERTIDDPPEALFEFTPTAISFTALAIPCCTFSQALSLLPQTVTGFASVGSACNFAKGVPLNSQGRTMIGMTQAL